MPRTWQKNNSRLIRFASVGVINTSIDFGILFLLRSLGLPAVPANIISTTIAFLFSFVANKHYTFKSKGANVRRELLLFTVVTLFGLWVLQSIIIWAGSLVFGTTTLALLTLKLIASIVSLIWNYLMYARVVFREGSH